MRKFLTIRSSMPDKSVKKIRLLILFLALFNALAVNAQNLTVKGTVTDASTNEVLPGVNIVVDGTTIGVVSDMDGKFTISVPSADATLIFSYVGYLSEKIKVEGKTEINISLSPDVKTMEEVVVIGYGTAKKRDLTGSVASVTGEKLKDIPINSAAEALTGKLAGVQITTTEGSPDAEVKIRVRGGGSITRDNSPLYIVDGFPVDRISDIPPTDIQSIDVLKDASSTAIYGSRGANGVVIVTTKSAKNGKITANYNGYFGFKKVTKMLDVMNPYEFANWQYEQAVLANAVQDQYEAYFGSYQDMDLYKYMKGTDWQDEVFGNQGTSQNHSFSITGGSETVSFNASYNRVDEKAIMLGSKFSRDNLNLKMNSNPLKWLKLNFSLRYSDTKTYGAGANDVTGTEKSTSDSRLKNAVIFTPITLKNMSAPDDDPESYSNLYPPTTTIPDNDRFRDRKYYSVNGDVSLNLTKWLVFRSEVGAEYTRNTDNRFFGLTTYYVTGGDATVKNKPAVQLTNSDANKFTNANTITSSFTKEKHNVSFMVGNEINLSKGNTLTSWIDGLPVFFDSNKAWAFTTQGVPKSSDNYFSPDDKIVSFFGRLNYDFGGRYLVSATYRADGSSKFAPGNRWGYFPSAALAWRVSEEKFMSSLTNWLSNLKLRFSYGSAGNNYIPPLSYMQVYNSTATSYLPASLATSFWAASSTMSNENLKWETTITRNLGMDFGFFKNRITGGVEVYLNKTKDLLIDFPVAGSGYTTQTRNLGKTSNKGLEFSVNSTIIDKKDFRLDFAFNISFNRNKVDDLGGLPGISANSAWTSDAQASNDYKVYVGEPVGLMYGYVTDGFYSANDFTWNGTKWVLKDKSTATPDNEGIDGSSWGPGALKLKDLNGDSIINENDKTIIGNAMPKHTGGFSITAYVKGFDVSANFNWVYGNDIYNANKIEFTTANKYKYRNMLASVGSTQRWTNVDPSTGDRITDPDQLAALNANAKIWSPGIGKYAFHSWAVEDGSFLRLNNITLGYTIPRNIISKIHAQQIRLYVSAYNLFVWTKYSGYDPEVDTRRKTPLTPGVDYSAYPRSRSFNLGVNLTF